MKSAEQMRVSISDWKVEEVKDISADKKTVRKENVVVLMEWIKKYENIFSLIPPSAGTIAFPRYTMKINSTELSTKIREEKSVFIVPGNCYGMDHYIRIGIGAEKDYLIAGLNLIGETLREFSEIPEVNLYITSY